METWGSISSRIKYPKILLLVFSYIISFILFAERSHAPLQDTLVSFGYFGTYVAGFLYAYAFTAATSTVILLILAGKQSLLFAGLMAGFGALLSDLIIFYLVKHGFSDEIQKFSKENFVQTAQKMVPCSIRKHLLAFLACFLIASPLPTEIGVTSLASIKNIKLRKFSIMAYILHTAAIFIILLIGSTI